MSKKENPINFRHTPGLREALQEIAIDESYRQRRIVNVSDLIREALLEKFGGRLKQLGVEL